MRSSRCIKAFARAGSRGSRTAITSGGCWFTLEDQTLRRIAELKLACYTNEEIRQQLGCSLRGVTLKLELIRKKWSTR